MAQDSIENVEYWKKRPAPIQVSEKDLPSSIPPQTGLTFNLWYNKWSQGNSGQSRFVSPYRLDVRAHEGRTRGDKAKQLLFCLYFSKGMCCLGRKCEYLHHVPTADDIAKLSLQSDVMDCFGREKHANYREDMGGVGTFRKKNRTVYVGGITGALNNVPFKSSQIENRIRFTFAKLGPLERIRYVETKNCAFVKYKHQTSAEFSKEAMSNQTLLIPSDKEWSDRSDGTGLLVKWANDDPNPEAQRREKEQQDQESLNVMLELIRKNDAKEQPSLENTSSSGKRLLEGAESEDRSLQSSIFSGLSSFNLRKLKKLKVDKADDVQLKEIPTAGLVEYPSSDDD
ncbi:LANO_0E10550g1_1 [Lachancea nothofagi CBS 11611]|uniref:Pre-mRNA-splicing factor CWC2 n=1 Tax=Lachancea nothofagi CBS 11611 TaxID=1266666 RepID=A0A1G4JWT6_9SACH|nr:LANO_0E10550g1_1 [Lachancea nothofagi CBS 11611]